MEVDPKDIRINRYYLGPGKGASVEAVHLPTGVSVAEGIPADSTETGRAMTARLLSALKLKIARLRVERKDQNEADGISEAMP